jgi:hypothetical protein
MSQCTLQGTALAKAISISTFVGRVPLSYIDQRDRPMPVARATSACVNEHQPRACLMRRPMAR